MPAKKKLSPAQKLKRIEEENKGFRKMAIDRLSSTEAITSSDGKTKIYNNLYMQKADGSLYIRRTERRSANKLTMHWRKI